MEEPEDLKSADEIKSLVKDKFDYYVKVEGFNYFDSTDNFSVNRLKSSPSKGYFIKNDNELYRYEGYMKGSNLVAECFTKDEVLEAIIRGHSEELAEGIPQANVYKDLYNRG